jgi:hypothetical protein
MSAHVLITEGLKEIGGLGNYVMMVGVVGRRSVCGCQSVSGPSLSHGIMTHNDNTPRPGRSGMSGFPHYLTPHFTCFVSVGKLARAPRAPPNRTAGAQKL